MAEGVLHLIVCKLLHCQALVAFCKHCTFLHLVKFVFRGFDLILLILSHVIVINHQMDLSIALIIVMRVMTMKPWQRNVHLKHTMGSADNSDGIGSTSEFAT